MPTPEQQTLVLLLLALFGPKIVTWLTARFVSKKDEAEKKLDQAAKEASNERDAREREMAKKIDSIATNLSELKSDAREDRARQIALQSSHNETKERINAVSDNHRPRIEKLEQKVAVLEAAAASKGKR